MISVNKPACKYEFAQQFDLEWNVEQFLSHPNHNLSSTQQALNKESGLTQSKTLLFNVTASCQ